MTTHIENTRAVIFDADGTLVDTIELIVKGFIESLARLGHSVDEQFVLSHIGGPVEETFARMLNLDHADPKVQGYLATLATRHDEIQDAHAHEWIHVFTGAASVLTSLKANTIKIGLFTSGSMYHVVRNFKAVGIDAERTFDGIVCADDKLASKPSPEGLVYLLNVLRVSADQVVVIGDHDVDMQAANAAYVRAAIGITHGAHSENELTRGGADYIITELPALLPLLGLEAVQIPYAQA